jgi:hypothetical protein
MRVNGDPVSNDDATTGENKGADVAAFAETHIVAGGQMCRQKSVSADGDIARNNAIRADHGAVGHFDTSADFGRRFAQDGKLRTAATQHVRVFSTIDRITDGADEKIVLARPVKLGRADDGRSYWVNSGPVIQKSGKLPNTAFSLRRLDPGGQVAHLATKGARAHDDEIFLHRNGCTRPFQKLRPR